jgi:hypothetical protein
LVLSAGSVPLADQLSIPAGLLSCRWRNGRATTSRARAGAVARVIREDGLDALLLTAMRPI